jgi:hypothetical protein
MSILPSVSDERRRCGQVLVQDQAADDNDQRESTEIPFMAPEIWAGMPNEGMTRRGWT